MVSDQPYKTGPLDRIERGIRRSQGAHGSARVDQTASVASTSQGVPNLPPPTSHRTRDDPSSLSPLATTFHPSSPQGISAVDSALAGITQRGSSKKSEPSLAGNLSSSTSAAHSVKSEDSSHYRTPITTDTTHTIPPIPSVVGPSSELNPISGFDSARAQCVQDMLQVAMSYLDQRLQAQEFAAQARQAAFEKKLLEKVERIEDDQAFFRGEVQAQKKSIGDLRVSVDKVTTEVTKLAEQVKAQHELKVDVTDHVTPEDLDQVWNQLNALQNAVFPESTSWIENPAFQPGSSSPSPAFHSALSGSPPASSSGYQSSITFDPIPSLHRAAPQPAGSSHQHAVPPVQRRLHGRGTSQGSLKWITGDTSHSTWASMQEPEEFLCLNFHLVPLLHHRRQNTTLLLLTQAREPPIITHFPERHPQLMYPPSFYQIPGVLLLSALPAMGPHIPQFLRTVQNELIELSPLCARPLQSYLQGNTMIATGKDSYSQRILGGVDKLESSPSSAFRTERFYQPYPHPGPHQFLQAWALVTHRHLSQPLPDEYRIWSANLKMGVSNSIDVVPPEEGVREFAERVLQVYDLFNMADPLMFAQELERYPTLHVFKAGLPEDYSPHITKILQELGVRTMDRDQQLMHIITKLQNYHEFVISVKHDNSGVTSTSGRNAHSSSAGHPTSSPPQAQETGYTRPLRRAFPAAHVSMLDEDVHDVPVHDAEYAYDAGPSHSQIPVDNDDQERVPSLQEELVDEVHAHATFPSTMHPRGNPRPPLPPSAGNSYQQRPPGSTGAPGPASTSRPTGAPGVGTTYQPNKMVCDICSETHWTRNCPRYSEAMSVYKKHLQAQGVNPRDPAPVGSAHFSHAVEDSWHGFSSLPAHDSSPSYSGGGTSNK
ncbi:hypothetical protein CEUSTIGMA_g12910.t1 [Chlamydomonas eustigma]|uniref:Uncharacterized protein n=1 Tax=Chlamydomonas eustigma TaxID=1157962 RepID=A0A250XR14_9CHLO|nr:hypothetical protein CEUSTIGMA_g12910.t1 [Chlamydomonas eustigma]|eukprot:GAX85494.1 hypothetical protein CEUSTIGMA_g12910.t1 [Chlamydomonas eustigma]